MPDDAFYGPDLAVIHHEGFGDIAAAAAELLLAQLRAAGHESGTIVDLACGTGILARIVADAGYDAIGFDYSVDMLAFAAMHAPAARLEQRSLYDETPLPRAIGFVANGDALNYATDARSGLGGVAAVARRVRAAIEPGGVFLFDVCTPGRAGPTGRAERTREGDDWTISATTVEAPDGSSIERSMTFRRGDGPERAERHVCHLYERADVEDLLSGAGFAFEVRTSYADEPTASTPPGGWIVVVARPEKSGGRT